jgi:hypothetical protein
MRDLDCDGSRCAVGTLAVNRKLHCSRVQLDGFFRVPRVKPQRVLWSFGAKAGQTVGMQLCRELANRSAEKVDFYLSALRIVPNPLKVFRTFNWLERQLLNLTLQVPDFLNADENLHFDEQVDVVGGSGRWDL